MIGGPHRNTGTTNFETEFSPSFALFSIDANATQAQSSNASKGKNHGKESPNMISTTGVHSLSMAEAT
jgi:hypothetical protein